MSLGTRRWTVGALDARVPDLFSQPGSGIWYAAQHRQQAVKLLAAEADLVTVVGSRNCISSKRLVEVAKHTGARDVHLVDSADEIDQTWLNAISAAGAASGASTPDVLVEQVRYWPARRGFEDVEAGKAAEKHQHFALPRELTKGTSRNASPDVSQAMVSGSSCRPAASTCAPHQ